MARLKSGCRKREKRLEGTLVAARKMRKKKEYEWRGEQREDIKGKNRRRPCG